MKQEAGGIPCSDPRLRRGCMPRTTLRFAVTAAHIGDTPAALDVLRAIDAGPHRDSVYKVDRARILDALGRRPDAIASLREAVRSVAPGDWMHAQPDLLQLRGDKMFEGIVRPRP